MTQTLNGHCVRNDAASYASDVGVFRTAIGNWNFTADTGAQAAYTIFTVTGNVYLYGIFGVCRALLDSGGAGTISLGIAGSAVSLIPSTVATVIDAGETWQDNAGTANPAPVILLAHSFSLAAGADIILTIGAADLTAGDLDIYAFWMPLSADGNVVAV